VTAEPRTWLPDPSHYPEQMTPLSASVWFEALGLGLHAAARELRAPFGGFRTRLELGWAYEGELSPAWQPDRSVLERAAQQLPDRWQSELRPRVLEINAELEQMRPELPAPNDAVALLDRMWSLVQEEWRIHFLVVLPALAAADLVDPELLVGIENPADDGIWDLADIARREGVEDVIRDFTPAAAHTRLHETQPGRRFLRELAAFLERFGGRSRWHELSLPREVERPELTLASVRLFLERGRPPEDRAAEREALERDVLARAPGLADALAVAKAAYPLKETHTYHVDYPGLLATREALLGFGRRLVAEGLLAEPDEVWLLEREELRASLEGDVELGVLVAERRGELERGRAEGPRPFLGAPPAEAERHAALEKFYGRAGEALRGAAASPGRAEGTARVVRDAADLARVGPGDVLVATTTTPAWTPLFPSIAALVTETGGILCHAAVVAREYRIPAVVGAAGATAAIPDGARVRVDGDSGEIAIL